MKYCWDCQQSLPVDHFGKDKSRSDGKQTRCFSCTRKALNASNKKLRNELLDAYGHACACCGERTNEFLALDHIFNDGASHRSKYSDRCRGVYRELRKAGYPKDRYRLLCHNCNSARGSYGRCPHEAEITNQRDAFVAELERLGK